MAHIIVTGANRGIGYFMAERLLEKGNVLAVLDVETDRLDALAERYGYRLLSLTCDVRDGERVARCVAEAAQCFGPPDVAVHNACLCTFAPALGTSEDTYRDVFDVNYFGALHLAKAALPYMKARGKGRVVFTSSGVGVMGFVNISPYASSKGAIEALAKCLSLEHSADGVTFHIFHPPLTKTASSAPLPVPQEFMADAKTVGRGLADHIDKKSFVLCHSFAQRLQTNLCYLFPLAMGRLMSKMTAGYQK
ncbi:MAG TPA: SDR family oxidoreductase [Clostridia bacterium]|nr:SDR family oxidoreductase [Clostridia bacterium]